LGFETTPFLFMELIQIKNNLLSSKASFDKIESEIFLSDFITDFRNYSSEDSDEIKQIWTDIFISLVHSGFLNEFLEKVNADDFYKFAEKLIHSENISNATAKLIHELLNIIRYPDFLQKIYGNVEWEKIILDLIRKSNYSLLHLYRQRVRDYPNKNLFHNTGKSISGTVTWKDFDLQVTEMKKVLRNLIPSKNDYQIHFAFLLENSIEMACLDVACLTSGFVNVMIPANSVAAHIEYILNETKVPVIFVNDERQFEKLNSVKSQLTYLKKIVLLNGTVTEENVSLISTEVKNASKMAVEIFEDETENINSLATIMYTSGTTGLPKGIMFTHLNIIYKRFCRAMAIPLIGDSDRFLAYLPLYHTFGRYLELMGTLFWAAEYYFLDDPSIQSLLNSFKCFQPTVFISVPKKWIQLYEVIIQDIDIEADSDENILSHVSALTGGKLKWGLSAAGFLPPEIFIFFQRNKIELMSGFGMTEATGGITMTLPFKYKINSLGKRLPGIEIKIAEDGELLIRGAYVMKGYFNESIEKTFIDGWLPTGDLMKIDDDGFVEIVDRKKEIYKNNRGETIAPQKIENLFNDFEAVKQVFLVGDHRPYNTILLFPNYDFAAIDLKKLSADEIYEYFSSIIVTVNNFLSPFERIIDYRIIDREISNEYDELTAKGTFKRKNIEKNFSELIEQMYSKKHLEIPLQKFVLRIPSWLLREKGCLNKDIIISNDKLLFKKNTKSLTLKIIDDENKIFRLGNFDYKTNGNIIDFQTILINPEYWLGNYELVEFSEDAIFNWVRQKNAKDDITFIKVWNREFECSFCGQDLSEITLKTLNNALLNLIGNKHSEDTESISFISKILNTPDSMIYPTIMKILQRPNLFSSKETIRKVFLILAKNTTDLNFSSLITNYLEEAESLLNKSTITELVNTSHKSNLIEISISLLKNKIQIEPKEFSDESVPFSLMNLLYELTIKHPSNYERVRQVLADIEINGKYDLIIEYAKKMRKELRKNFRKLLGENLQVAVDSETGEDYYWKDVVTFDSNIQADEQEIIFNCISTTNALKEAVFLFSKGKVVNLDNLMIGGVWITKEREYYNKKIFRVSLHTRYFGSFELVINLEKNKNREAVYKEVSYLILAGSRYYVQELVEDFGGYWEEYNLWTSKYIAGDTLDKYFFRQTRRLTDETEKRLYHLWPFFVWNAAAAYFNFWRLSNYKSILSYPGIENFIIPPHDYQTGTKVVSLSESFDFKSFTDLFRNFYTNFVEATENKYPFLKRNKIWSFIAAGLVNAEGIENAKVIIKKYLSELQEKIAYEDYWNILEQILNFLAAIDKGEFLPKQLYFAIKRYRRWYMLNPEAAFEAKFDMFKEMNETYQIQKIENEFPASRLTLFYETVLHNCNPQLKEKVKELIYMIKQGNHPKGFETEVLSSLLSSMSLTEGEKYFITRFTFPHINEATSAEIIGVNYEGKFTTNLIVQYEDEEGLPFFIRKPISPKEISRLHQLFIESNMTVNFRSEHDYLVAVSERGFILGGIFYYKQNETTIHMEKIVVSARYRRKGIGDKLMKEFFDRMKILGIGFITTGFFRPEYFYKFGFKVAKKYSGFVKEV
jgi:long-subunit acyl-CoA synthetase (AMP-forming)/predicted GNAT family acetyltransferase